MKNLYLLIAVGCICLQSIAQVPYCITPPLLSKYVEQQKASVPLTENYATKRTGTLRNVALNINIMVYSSGPITSVSNVQQQIDTANIFFANAGIKFTICHVNYIVYTGLTYSWDFNYEYQIGAVYDLPGCLNIYYVNYIANASAYAYYPAPYSPDRVIMGQHLSGEIFAHELGHSFFLIHTHGNYNTGNGTDELVNGSNCTSAGDLICDTPADPNLYLPGRLDTLCNYLDTVTTDSLGFLYTPDTRNIMSYSYAKCYDHFSPGQYNRMAYTLAHERAYLKSGEHFAATMNAPATACIYDAPIMLTANPPGGFFTGDGITGSQFDPAAAGPGAHIITYTAPVTANNPESTDAYYAYDDTVYTTQTAWQSFTSAADENLLSFSFKFRSNVTQNIYVSIYDSIGISGVWLMQDTISINADSVFSWNKLTFQSPFHLNAGQNYTVEVSAGAAIDFAGNKNNVYPAGISMANGDLAFITHVIPDVPTCGNNAYASIYVSDPPAPVVTSLFPVYCLTANPQPIQTNPVGGNVTIDGMPQTVLDPWSLGTGVHSLHCTYIDFAGCTHDSIFSFVVNDTTAILNNFNSTLCSNDSVISLTGVPPGGNFYMDGNLLSPPLLDPAVYAPGQHVLSYTYPAEYPWIDTTDQDNYFSISNSSYALSNGQMAWQSFTAGAKGYLNLIDFGLYVSDTVRSPFKLYRGQGTGGPLLYADTARIYNNSSYDQGYIFPSYQILLEKDSVYTFEVGLDPVVSNSILYNDSAYTRGMANLALFGLPEVDFKFRTHINSIYACGQDSIAESVVISGAPVVNLGNDLTVPVGFPVMLDAGNTGSSFLWSTGDITQQLTINGGSGSYVVYVTVTQPNGCSASDTIMIDFITGLSEPGTYFTFSPNPVTELLTIRSSEPIASVAVWNSVGQQVMKQETTIPWSGLLKLNTSSLATGLYEVQLVVHDRVFVQRFLKR